MRFVIRIYIITLLLTLFVFTCANAAINSDGTPQLPVSQTTEDEELSAEETPENRQTASMLPSSLQIIDESAFEGTALVNVELPESLEYIGDMAFANILSLRNILIPDHTEYIGKDAFTGSRQVTITAYANTYARTWARNNGIPFAPIAAVTAINEAPVITGLNTGEPTNNHLSSTEIADVAKYSERNSRAEGEIKAVKHKECFANIIQGRSPPVFG